MQARHLSPKHLSMIIAAPEGPTGTAIGHLAQIRTSGIGTNRHVSIRFAGGGPGVTLLPDAQVDLIEPTRSEQDTAPNPVSVHDSAGRLLGMTTAGDAYTEKTRIDGYRRTANPAFAHMHVEALAKPSHTAGRTKRALKRIGDTAGFITIGALAIIGVVATIDRIQEIITG